LSALDFDIKLERYIQNHKAPIMKSILKQIIIQEHKGIDCTKYRNWLQIVIDEDLPPGDKRIPLP